ncbi:MAG: TolC family protein [Bacteroidales bacterium]|nr:TolC family protein [Bacteroidales bacterium]
MRHNFFISIAVIAAASVIGTEARGQQAMTLRDCMQYAVSHSTKVRIQQAATGDAQLARRDAILSAFLPTLNASSSASYNFGRNIDPETNTYINTVSFNNGYALSAGITLFNGFSAVNNLRISRTSLKMGRTREKQVEADICLAVMEAYCNVLYYKRLCEACEEQVATAEQTLVKARRQEELGQKGHADVIQMEADLADRQYNLINAANQYESEKMTLADLMFWPTGEELTIDTAVPMWSEESLDADAVAGFALQHDPAVLLAAWGVENARRELNTARWQLLPSLSLNGGWSTSYYSYQGNQTTPYWEMLRTNGGEYVALTLNVPIFNRLSRQSAIGRKRNALKKAEAEYDQAQRDVESEVRRAVRDRDGSASAWQQARRKAEVQSEAYALNLKKLEQGLISPLEYQTASNNYLKARADEMESLLKYLIKQAVVKYYSGIEYIDQ